MEGVFLHVEPGGRVLDRIATSGWAVACVLGGPTRTTLFMLRAEVNLEKFARIANRSVPDSESGSRGRVDTLEVQGPGVGRP